ncbi:MAG: DUF29 family protein [Chroococcidiopsidaceae cyanobacterium CP_BM_ER_R8_30]|nr:DUF29 family protein [Chroococcidiopsidaceae cyanobacterium CP_BM_ER_R8_30]
MPSLYDSDFVLWSEKTAKALRDRSFNDLDWDNLIDEIEQLGRNNKHALSSQLRRLLHHLLQWEYQPDKTRRIRPPSSSSSWSQPGG